MSIRKIGVLVMSYGTPESLTKIEEYYTHIRRGNPPTAEQLQTLRQRYEAIVGGFFPLRENTNKQVNALEDALNRSYNGFEFVCYQGLKHAVPYIEDGVQQMAEDGITEAIGVVLAPHYSLMSVGDYIQRATARAEEHGISMKFVKNYHLHPAFIEAWTERVGTALSRFPGIAKDDVRVLFSAHSLPERILAMNDPYPQQLLETSQEVAKRAGITNWQFTWQSAGQTAIPWLGPDILDTLRTIHRQDNVNNVLVCPLGFVSDHMEVLYDIDIECQGVAKQLGMHLERAHSLNTDEKYIKTLSDVVYAQVERS